MTTTIPAETIALIYRTSRADALASGALVAPDAAAVSEAGFRLPVYVTRAAWDRCVAVTPCAAQMACDERGRLWDLLWMLRQHALRGDADETGPLPFEFFAVTTVPHTAHRVRLFAFFVGRGEEAIVIATAPETLGPTQGEALDRLLQKDRGFSDTDDEDEDEESLHARLRDLGVL